MPEKKVRVKIFKLEYICDKCKKGKMEPEGTVFFTNPIQYPHVCNKCGELQNFRINYPYTTYEDGEELY
jgi:DNA replicative helicase MCM subunit Mcm2 (Cdc46/Mcm family)